MQGIYCPIVTPFKGDGIDFDGLEKNLEFLERSRIAGVVPLGTAGEFSSLSESEKRAVVERVAGCTKLPLIVGASSTCLQDSLELIRYSKKFAIAALVAPPYYFLTNEEGLFEYYSKLAAKSKLPIILYNIPLTKNPLSPRLVAKLASEKIIGIKDTSAELKNFIEMARVVPKDFSLLIGHDSLVLPALIHGAKGGILGSSNFVPKLLLEIYRNWRKDLKRAAKLQEKLMLAVEIIGTGTFPAGLKYAMNRLGLAGGSVRPPLLDLDPSQRKRVDGILEKLGLLR